MPRGKEKWNAAGRKADEVSEVAEEELEDEEEVEGAEEDTGEENVEQENAEESDDEGQPSTLAVPDNPDSSSLEVGDGAALSRVRRNTPSAFSSAEDLSGKLVATQMPPASMNGADYTGGSGTSLKAVDKSSSKGKMAGQTQAQTEKGPSVDSGGTAPFSRKRVGPPKRLLGIFRVPLKCLKSDSSFRAVTKDRVKELQSTFNRIDVNEMSSTFIAVTDHDVPSSLKGEISFTPENLQKCLDLGHEEFLVVEAGNHRLVALLQGIEKGDSKYSMDTKVPCRVYTNCDKADRLDLAAQDNIGCTNTLAISFAVIIQQLRVIMREVFEQTRKQKQNEAKPLIKPNLEESELIKKVFMQRFAGTTTTEWNSTVNRYLKFALYPPCEEELVIQFAEMLEKKGTKGIAAIPGEKASIAGGTCKIGIGKTALEQMMHYRITNQTLKKSFERPWYNILEHIELAVSFRSFASFSKELAEHPVDPEVQAAQERAEEEKVTVSYFDVNNIDLEESSLKADKSKGKKRKQADEDEDKRQTRAGSKKLKNVGGKEGESGQGNGRSDRGRGSTKSSPTVDDEESASDAEEVLAGVALPPASSSSKVSTGPTVSPEPKAPSNSKAASKASRPSTSNGGAGLTPSVSMLPSTPAVAVPRSNRRAPRKELPAKTVPTVVSQYVVPTEIELAAMDEDNVTLRNFREAACNLTEMILRHPIERLFFGAPLYCTEDGKPSAPETPYVRFRLYRIPHEFKLIETKGQEWLPVLDYGWIITDQVNYLLVHANTDQHFNTNALGEEEGGEGKAKKYGDHMKDKLLDCTVNLTLKMTIPINEEYYTYKKRNFKLKADFLKPFYDLFDHNSFGKHWKPWPLNDPTDPPNEGDKARK